MRRALASIGLAALACGGCARTAPAPQAIVAKSKPVTTRGVDCATRNYVVVTTTVCGSGTLDPLSAAGE